MNKVIQSHLNKLKDYKNNVNKLKTIPDDDKFWLRYKITKSIRFLENELGIADVKLTLTELRNAHMDNLD